MLDVKAVGSDLTPAQQDEVIADLAFFLDEFGSTRAVRAKLHEQQSEIKRLRRLVSHDYQILQEEDSKEGAFAIRSSEKESEEVDEIMVDLSFLLGPLGRRERFVRSWRIKSRRLWPCNVHCSGCWRFNRRVVGLLLTQIREDWEMSSK